MHACMHAVWTNRQKCAPPGVQRTLTLARTEHLAREADDVVRVPVVATALAATVAVTVVVATAAILVQDLHHNDVDADAKDGDDEHCAAVDLRKATAELRGAGH